MGEIVLLDELTINKIAAGEVIERPASVIKEMVENSIDAGANNIKIEIKNGGISYIRITDNGKGIAEDDVEMAFESHATSKIRQADDLNTVKTMGFRGEALASIAAIANVELVTKCDTALYGTKLIVEAGKILEKSEVGAPRGTTITVRNLFFNTPVRYKFLRRDFTEAGYIEDAITRLALSHPHIMFTLINSGKTVIQTSGNNDLKTIVYNIYGKDIAEALVTVDSTYDDIKITGVIGKPEIARSNRSNQIFFINDRYVKDKTLSAAIEEGYRTLIPHGKFAFAVLNININPHQVDVNVHPAKLEVRFEDEQKVFKAVYHSVKNSLLSGDLIPGSKEIENKDQTKSEQTIVIPTLNKIEVKSENENIKEADEKNNNNISELNNSNIDTPKRVGNRFETEEKDGVFSSLRKLMEKRQKESKSHAIDEVVASDDDMDNDNFDSFQDALKLNENSTLKEKFDIFAETQNIAYKNQEIEEKLEPQLEQDADVKSNLNMENKGEFKEEDSQENIIEEKQENITGENHENSTDFNSMYSKLFGVKINTSKEEKSIYPDVEEFTVKDNTSIFENKEVYNEKVNYKYIGTAFATYIIIEMEDGIYLIDQHAAHERIMYEKIKKNFYSTDKQSQMMLLPDIITLSNRDMLIVKENINLFEKAGFTLEEFGEGTIKLIGVPDVCMELDTKELFIDLIDGVDLSIRTTSEEKEEKFIATVACKAAVKAKMVLKIEEIESLLNELLVLPNPFTCPHGRPTAIKMTKSELDRKFSRT